MIELNIFEFSYCINHIIVLVLFAVLALLIYILLKEIQKQKKAKVPYILNPVINRRILTMLGGDEKADLRLLRGVRRSNPGRSYVWYREKVIRDLERDRR